MKRTTFYLLLAVLLGITALLSFAQQNQNTQKPNPEIEALKSRISVLENKLQTIENVEKMELEAKLLDAQAKLADANAKLINAEFGKFERELRDSNDGWLRNWSLLILAILSVFGVFIWSQFKSKADQLIADEVEKSLNEFKEAVAQLDEIKNQLKVLQKEHAVSVLVPCQLYIDSEF